MYIHIYNFLFIKIQISYYHQSKRGRKTDNTTQQNNKLAVFFFYSKTLKNDISKLIKLTFILL